MGVYIPSSDKKSQIALIGGLIDQADEVIHAGDPDDEGQLIVDELLTYFKCTKPVYRLSTNDNNSSVIFKALKNLKPNSIYEPMGKAALARSVSDYIFGINLTRFYSIAHRASSQDSRKPLSVGRVQTPTLGLVVNRDLAIKNYVVNYYYQLQVVLDNQLKMTYQPNLELDDVNEVGQLDDKETLKVLADSFINKTLKINVKRSKKKESPPLPFNITKLQSTASKAFGFSLKKTLDLTQSLREKHKAITYNRTDSQYLNLAHHQEAGTVLPIVVNNLMQYANVAIDPTIKSRAFDDSKVTAHHAIIPTAKKINVSELSADELKIYDLIAKYYLMQFMPPAIYGVVEAVATLTDDPNRVFKAKTSMLLKPGYLEVFKKEVSDPDAVLIRMTAGEHNANICDSVIHDRETKPAAPYTDATLVTDMTSIAKYVTDPSVKKILIEKDAEKKGENGSIGTSATRASIIETLIKRGYIKRQKKQIVSTELGQQFYNSLPDNIRLPDVTARWWSIQEEIISGNAVKEQLIEDVLSEVKKVLRTTPKAMSISPSKSSKADRFPKMKIIDVCPTCKQQINLVDGKFGRFWSHADFKNNTCPTQFDNIKDMPVVKKTCPYCNDGLLGRKKGSKGYFWGCSNYKNGCKATFKDEKGKPILVTH